MHTHNSLTGHYLQNVMSAEVYSPAKPVNRRHARSFCKHAESESNNDRKLNKRINWNILSLSRDKRSLPMKQLARLCPESRRHPANQRLLVKSLNAAERQRSVNKTLWFTYAFRLLLHSEVTVWLDLKWELHESSLSKRSNYESNGTFLDSSVAKCPPFNWKVACSIHSHWVNCRSAPWARAFTSTAPARSTIQASACRELPSPKLTTKEIYVTVTIRQAHA